MALTLYHGQPNGPSFTVLAAVAEKGVEAEHRLIDLAAGGRHAADVPRNREVDMSIEGEGPVLVADGEAMADSVFIACYLDDAFAGPALRPADPYTRWEMMSWCRYVIERIAPAAAYLGVHAAGVPAIDGTTVASDDLRERWAAAAQGQADEARLADSRSKIEAGVARVEAKLEDGRQWLIGDFSIADLETYAWLAGMRAIVPQAFAGQELTKQWIERLEARPAVQAALARATVADPAAVWAPGPEINRWG
ncbi:MAG: glutathione S-transferase family protein [Sphingomonas fennica]